jgi:hypothetical protein
MIQLRQAGQIRFDDSTVLLLHLGNRAPKANPLEGWTDSRIREVAEEKIRGAMKSIKGSLRKGLKGLSESRWLDDPDRS